MDKLLVELALRVGTEQNTLPHTRVDSAGTAEHFEDLRCAEVNELLLCAAVHTCVQDNDETGSETEAPHEFMGHNQDLDGACPVQRGHSVTVLVTHSAMEVPNSMLNGLD